MAERARRLREQERVAAPERLGIRPVGQRDLDLDEDVARPWLGPRHLLDPQVARAVVAQRSHGVNTTLTAS